VAALIQKELGLKAEMIEAGRGVFVVSVGGRKVAGKNWLGLLPSGQKVVDSIRQALGT
jgi:hypothetical protein